MSHLLLCIYFPVVKCHMWKLYIEASFKPKLNHMGMIKTREILSYSLLFFMCCMWPNERNFTNLVQIWNALNNVSALGKIYFTWFKGPKSETCNTYLWPIKSFGQYSWHGVLYVINVKLLLNNESSAMINAQF